MAISFCPSLGKNHKSHGSVEKLVQAIKAAIGSLDLRKTGLDVVNFQNFLERLFNQINMVPLYSRVKTGDQPIFSCFPLYSAEIQSSYT